MNRPLEAPSPMEVANDLMALAGRPAKAAARELARRGLGVLNRSGSRIAVRPAGRFVVAEWDRAS